jgi:hypothetical protein
MCKKSKQLRRLFYNDINLPCRRCIRAGDENYTGDRCHVPTMWTADRARCGEYRKNFLEVE